MKHDLLKKFQEICKKNSWRCTIQKWTIFEIMYQNKNHPVVEEIWKEAKQKIPTISLDTVYRILNEFCQVGLLQKITTCKKSHFDGNNEPHGHFSCSQCGKIIDLPTIDLPYIQQGINSIE